MSHPGGDRILPSWAAGFSENHTLYRMDSVMGMICRISIENFQLLNENPPKFESHMGFERIFMPLNQEHILLRLFFSFLGAGARLRKNKFWMKNSR